MPADSPSPREVILFISGQTADRMPPRKAWHAGQRPAYGADGTFIDHLSAQSLTFIKEIGGACSGMCANYPHSIFCDSP